MKKSLQEDLIRIHELTYGKRFINEQSEFMDKILQNTGIKPVDEPKKADLVSDDVKEFFKTLEDSSKTGGLLQQDRGKMTFQKGVESMQIGLILLGYELPRFGVDGLFGPETGAAVRKFKKENLTDEINEAFVEIGDTNYSNVKVDSDSKYDEVNSDLLDDLQKAGEATGIVLTITTASKGHSKYTTTGNESRHGFGTAVDISILNGVKASDPKFKEYGDKLKDELVSMGYTWNSESGNPKAVLWQTSVGGNHYNHVHVSNKSGVSGGSNVNNEVATPEMLDKLTQMLKERGVKSEELKKYIDVINLEGLADKNFYAKLLENLGAPISEENLKFLYAWRQAEGKGGINNPFNTTYTMPNSESINSAGVKSYNTLEDGMIATIKTLKNGRYDCIVDGLKRDIGADKIARCESLETWGTGDLVSRVVASYNSGSTPKIASLA